MPDDYPDDISTSGSVPIAGATTGNIEIAGDVDWFAIQLTAGVMYTFTVTSFDDGTGLGDPVLGLRDSLGTVLTVVDTGTSPEVITRTATATGTYFLSVSGFQGTTGNYTLAATSTPRGTNGSIAIDEDTGHTFTIADFGFVDPDAGDVLGGVRFSVPTRGTLILDDQVLTVATRVSASDIAAGKLEYRPAPDGNGSSYVSVGFRVVDQNGVMGNSNSLTFNVAAMADPVTFAGDAAGDVHEDAIGGSMSHSGVIQLIDVDDPANAIIAYDLDTTYGQFQLAADGAWTYELTGNGLAAVQALGANGSLQEQFSVNSVNGESTNVTITIHGANDAPIFSSGTSVTVDENATAALSASASDVEASDQVTYSFGGGDDDAAFEMDANTGAITFRTAPDHEAPSDLDADNIYEIVVVAADGNGGTTPQNVSITVGNMTGVRIAGTGDDDVVTDISTPAGSAFVTGEEDTIRGYRGNDILFGLGGNDAISGGAGFDLLRGGDGSDLLIGGADKDRIAGGTGGDRLIGGEGNDRLRGNLGEDVLLGGRGDDHFLYRSVKASNEGRGIDVIKDFGKGEDIIDLAAIDGDGDAGSMDRFTFIGGRAFSGHAGELHKLTVGNALVIEGDIDGDGQADVSIILTGEIGHVSASDFRL